MISVSVLGQLVLFQWRHAVTLFDSQTCERLDNHVHDVLRQRYSQAALGLTFIEQNPRVQRAFAERDRKALLAQLEEGYRLLDDRLPQFHFHLPNAVSFLRVHDPGCYGDDLSRLRKTVVLANQEQREVRALEIGVAGLGMRVVRPMYYQGAHIGSVEYGLDVGTSLVSELQGSTSDEYAIYTLQSDNAITRLASSPGATSHWPDAVDFDTLRAGSSYAAPSRDQQRSSLFIPFMDVHGRTIGFFHVLVDRSFLQRQVNHIQKELALFTLGAMLLGSTLMLIATRSVTHSIGSIVQQTKEISSQIVGGNLAFRGNVRTQPTEFRPIIREINTIITALRSSETQRLAILDGFPGILLYLDHDERVVWANRRADELITAETGATPSLGMHSTIPVHRAFTEDTIVREVHRVNSHPNGALDSSSWWDTVCIPVSAHGNDKTTHVIVIALDISAQIRTQQELETLARTLEERVSAEVRQRKLQEERVHRQAQLASLGEIAAGIAHEINQPLAALSLTIENLLTRYHSNTLEEGYLARKSEAVQGDILRIRTIIDHIRELSHQNHHREEPFDLYEVLENATLLLGSQYRSHGVELTVQPYPRSTHVCGNRLKVEQAVLNVVANAHDAVLENHPNGGGRITIGTLHTSTEASVIVRDNGPGIPPTIRDRIFDPFFTTKEVGQGTGLGLSISNAFIQRMGGHITVRTSADSINERRDTPPTTPEAAWWCTEVTIVLPLPKEAR